MNNIFGILLPQVLLLETALIVICLKIASARIARYSHYVGLLGVIAALISLPYVSVTGEVRGFVVDPLGLVGTGFILGAAGLVLVYSTRFLDRTNLPRTEWTFLLLSASLGLSLMLSTHNLMILFIGLELSSLAFYVLCGYFRDNDRSLESALKYFTLGSVGSAVLLLGIALLFVNQQTVVITDFSLQGTPGGRMGFMLSSVIVFLGFLFKLSIVPLQFWVPDVYEGAPTPITAYMSVGVKIAVLCAFIRILTVTGYPGSFEWFELFWWGSTLTILGGNILALVQDHLKRMLAYSSVAHAGYLLMGLVALTREGYSAILFYLLVYLFMNILAFGVISLLESEDDRYTYSDLRGLSASSPLLAAGLAVSMISLSGLPPTAGFMGKLFLFYGVVRAGFPILAVIGVVGSMISVAYYFRVIVHSYMLEPSNDGEFIGVSAGFLTKLTTAVTALLILYLGVNPTTVYNQLTRVVDGIRLNL